MPQCLDLARPPVHAATCFQGDSPWRPNRRFTISPVSPSAQYIWNTRFATSSPYVVACISEPPLCNGWLWKIDSDTPDATAYFPAVTHRRKRGGVHSISVGCECSEPSSLDRDAVIAVSPRLALLVQRLDLGAQLLRVGARGGDGLLDLHALLGRGATGQRRTEWSGRRSAEFLHGAVWWPVPAHRVSVVCNGDEDVRRAPGSASLREPFGSGRPRSGWKP